MERKKQNKKILRSQTGIVGTKCKDKTVSVKVVSSKRHRLYSKLLSKRKNYLAHCEIEVKIGDKVLLNEIKPRSKNKTWEIIKNLTTENDTNSD